MIHVDALCRRCYLEIKSKLSLLGGDELVREEVQAELCSKGGLLGMKKKVSHWLGKLVL